MLSKTPATDPPPSGEPTDEAAEPEEPPPPPPTTEAALGDGGPSWADDFPVTEEMIAAEPVVPVWWFPEDAEDWGAGWLVGPVMTLGPGDKFQMILGGGEVTVTCVLTEWKRPVVGGRPATDDELQPDIPGWGADDPRRIASVRLRVLNPLVDPPPPADQLQTFRALMLDAPSGDLITIRLLP